MASIIVSIVIVSIVSAIIAVLSLSVSIFLFLKRQRRDTTMLVYRAHLDSIQIGIDHPYVLNWEPERVGELNSEQTKIYYQYVFFLLNVVEMSEKSESVMLDRGQLIDVYANVHKDILMKIPPEICTTFSETTRAQLRARLPGSNW